MESGKKRQYISILVHVLVWILLGFFFLLYQPLNWGIRLPVPFLIASFVHLILLAALFYLNALWGVPKYLLQNRTAAFIGGAVASTLVVMSVNAILEWSMQIRRLIDQALGIKTHDSSWVNVFILVTTLLVLGISTSITVIQHWQRQTLDRQSLEQQQVSSELSFLKNQINPHFFFNTLNNIYALTFVDVSKSRDSLHKLSRMMRYLLYETHDRVPLTREVDFIRDYIELMRMRLQENTTIELEESSLPGDVPIYPMLLLPFVENAFKHGVSALAPGMIRVRLALQGRKFCFEVENRIVRQQEAMPEEAGGIGLVNTRRRLELLYPGRHRLEIREQSERGQCESKEPGETHLENECFGNGQQGNEHSGNFYYILLEIDL